MIITAVDPGGMTGIATITWDGSPIPGPDSLVDYDQVPYADMPSYVDRWLFMRSPRLIVVERFNITPRTVKFSRQPEALYTIGAILFAAEVRGVETRLQNPSDKDEVTNEMLADWGVRGGHAKDALRHLLLACRARGLYTRLNTDLTET